MRIPIWPGVRLSVWEKQNSEAVKVTMPNTVMRGPVRRVLSKRGWMILLVRYDWQKSGRFYSPGLREQSERPTHPDGTPYRFHEIQAEGWGFCEGCRMWSTGTVTRPHRCDRSHLRGPGAER
ncbi:hypothetical protein [Streptomyces pseudovenezuelae]|uniref:hypothetical protein n=1 Tax=Streptomyces pseudovenezuelae TaxID=67350 RepID=UPI0036E31E52